MCKKTKAKARHKTKNALLKQDTGSERNAAEK